MKKPPLEWEAEDDVKGGPLDPHEIKTARRKDIQYLWDRDMSTPPKRKHGHDRDANQLTSSGSVPTKVAPKPTLSLASGVFGGAP